MNRRRLLKTLGCCAGATLTNRGFGAAQKLSGSGLSEATTTGGRVRGFFDRGVLVFKGIPYGADTTALRFMAPLPPKPWAGVLETTDFGARAPQRQRHLENLPTYHFPPELGSVSEDCLKLNVWTTGLRDGRKRPVMVYIHGGAYSSGSANNDLYDGVNLCRRSEVVVVTLNHRLNLFGFLYLAELLPELPDSGNVGMMDLVLALQWVQDNIESFGGDPKRVLIFGQSGGGAKCATLMGMPAARGLFHRVITMSGQQVTGSRRESAAARALAVLDALKLPQNRAGELRKMPMERLIDASAAAGYYGPVVDGRTLERDPFAPDAPLLSRKIPLILGNTHDETRLLIGGTDPATFSLTWESLPEKLAHHSQFLGNLKLDDVIRRYREIYPGYSASDIFFAVTTASRSWRGQLIEAERRAVQLDAAPTWVYEFDWRTPVGQGQWGAPHTLDIPFALDNIEIAKDMCGNGGNPQRLGDLMSRAWISFAQTGNPNHAGLANWAPYNLEDRSTMSFDRQSRLVRDPRRSERLLIEQVPYTQPGT